MSGPLLSVEEAAVVQIMRNVTGRVDKNDPAFTDGIMVDYLNAFLQQEHPQEVQLFQNRTWWTFTIDENTANPMPVDLDALGYSTLGPLAYVGLTSPNNPNTFKMFWYTDPGDFYRRWPVNATFINQMPTNVLYYNNELTFRGPPDQEYSVQIQAYRIDPGFTGGDNTNGNTTLSTVPQTYLTRYLAYGASLSILSDFGEMERYNEVFNVYRRYRGQVLSRTWNQLQSQRTGPDF